MSTQSPIFQVDTADTPTAVRAAQRLRYDVFVDELGGDGPLVDHEKRLEMDRFDKHAIHLLLRDVQRPAGDDVVGVYRLLDAKGASDAGQFYCEDEYDLTPLRRSGKRLLELGRSCLHPGYRGGTAMIHLWSALSDYVSAHQVELLFGVASFPGADPDELRHPLGLLHHRHLAPAELRAKARSPGAYPMDRTPADQIDRVCAMRNTPSLIKAYLRLGGMVGEGAFVDKAFNTVDVCLILPIDAISDRQRAIYAKGQPDG